MMEHSLDQPIKNNKSKHELQLTRRTCYSSFWNHRLAILIISNNQDITWNFPAPNNGPQQDNYIFGNPYQPSFLTVTGTGVNPTHHHHGGTPSTTLLLGDSCHGSPIRMAMLQIGGRNMEAVQHLAVLPLTDLMGSKSVRAMRWDQLGSWKHCTWNWTFKRVIIHNYSPGNR